MQQVHALLNNGDMMSEEKVMVEIKGVKMELDLRTAKRVDTFQVGMRVKVLVKGYQKYNIYPGVIVGFDPFENLPSITVCYITNDYSGAKLEFITFNNQSEEIEIVPALDQDHLEVSRDNILEAFDRDITKKMQEVEEIQMKKRFFLRAFKEYFKQAEPMLEEELLRK